MSNRRWPWLELGSVVALAAPALAWPLYYALLASVLEQVKVVVLDPSAATLRPLGLIPPLAWPGLAGLGAAVACRLSGGRAPRPLEVLGPLGITAAAVAGGLALRLVWLHHLAASPAIETIEPMVSLADLGFGRWAFWWGGVAGVITAASVGARAARSRGAS